MLRESTRATRACVAMRSNAPAAPKGSRFSRFAPGASRTRQLASAARSHAALQEHRPRQARRAALVTAAANRKVLAREVCAIGIVLLWMRGGLGEPLIHRRTKNANRRDHCHLRRRPGVAVRSVLKRVSFREYRNNATCDDEAYLMRDAGELIREALAERGYAPR